MNKSRLRKELKKLQQQEKARAEGPHQKVIEEATEVVMAHLGWGNVAEEKVDLLMTLIAWVTTKDLKKWQKKMKKRGRTPTTYQQQLLNMFGV